MKKIFSLLFALLFMVGTTGVFTSCQEDAPEINYTLSVTVNNDFTEVVNAINNGTMKQEAAIAALTAAINSMNGEQNAKMDAIVKAINDLAKTTDAKLAIIEAAMKAQTLALENKLALLDAAIKALPDYTDQLKAIEAAIKALPDYSTKLAAIETAIKNIPDYSEKMAAIEAAIKNAPDYTTALKDIKDAIAALPNYTEQLGAIITAIEALPDYTKQLEAIAAAVETIPDYSDKLDAIQTALAAIAANIEAQEGQYADELAALKTSIDAIKSEVAAGNTSQEDALAEIIALLESGAIAGGGSGSGSGGEGDEPIGPYILLKTENPENSIIEFACYESELKNMSGVAGLEIIDATDGEVTKYRGILTSQEVKLYGMFTEFHCSGQKLKEIDTQKQSTVLEILMLDANPDLKFDFKSNTNLKYLDLRSKKLEISEVEDLVKKLPNRSSSGAECFAYCSWRGETINKCVKDADAKGWILHLLIP